MSNWSLATLLANLHDDIEQRLAAARESFAHPTTKGDASENIWLELLQNYLPEAISSARRLTSSIATACSASRLTS